MTVEQPVMGRTLAVARVLADVVGAQDAGSAEGRLEHRGIAWHGEVGELFARHPGHRIERIALSMLVGDVVEERAELRARKLGRGVGHGLYDAFKIEFAASTAPVRLRVSRVRVCSRNDSS